ncbi:Flp pilus assembly ATP-binding protein CpaE [Rhizobium phaseoli]|uniref:CpaE family protein n=2 Tax=Rhizobium TaxID=379 RepID=A0A192T5Z4_9HYPH|nr:MULTISPECIES: CpaE family protein [Rhizobium]ACE89247.1 pilus assembly, two-component response regulator protein [Rhizobium etli CIAT 652]KEC72145.1 pilus assembly, two-component response regulator protein [Rhizobium leguminosarum bv. phaseoli CCGM1]ANL26136.1 Flp pilus assembly ATP-binding protein CpaE [Rhizobium phaseoli]ANL32374.1 Flp pilus assembly ATP-binding protein CpaE [Rhizobium phaseoli]ANL38703.1 Flp pilus assembly ATP-binding protein CpaE [Rhizobium phaseoli]
MSAIEYEIKNPSELRHAEEAVRMADLEAMRPLPRISVHAFCESETLQNVMERCANDRRMAKVSLRITSGGIAAAANMFSGAPTPNLIILETKANVGSLLAELAPLAAVCDPTTKVVIVGYYNDIGLYRELIRNGISEYMVQPVAMPDILAAMASIFVDPEAEPLGRSIAFIGSKGGVGASTIAHNCAFGISNLFSTETILADLDLPYGTANIDFDQDPAQGIAEAVFAPDRLDEVFLDRLLTKCSEHLSLLAAPSLLDRAYDFDGQAFQPVLDVLQRSAPVTVLDVPHAWSEWTRSVLASVDEVVIAAVPDLANLRNTKNMLDALRKMRPNDKPPHLILNQVGMPKRPEISPSDFCEPLEIDPIAIIPFDINLFGNAANSGRMISEVDPRSPTAETFSQISHIVTGRAAIRKAKKGGLLGLLKRK